MRISGFDVNSVDNGGFSCLHDAANHGYFEIVKLLVEAGAVVNKESKDFSHRCVIFVSPALRGLASDSRCWALYSTESLRRMIIKKRFFPQDNAAAFCIGRWPLPHCLIFVRP